jgi:hypothetical protein
MGTSIGTTIANAASMGPRYAQRLLGGVSSERFARFAAPGGETVQANHPAFVLGHLCLYPVKVVSLLGGDTSRVAPPASFEAAFSKEATCQDDASGEHYPSQAEVVDFFMASYAAAIEAVRNATDETLQAPNPVDTPLKDVLPTLGSMLAFYLTSHVMMHLGQLSTWRRMEKLPPA